MEWGVHVPHLGRQLSRASLVRFAQEIERLGAHSAWVSDHICWPAERLSKYPYTADGSFGPSPDMGWIDPISTLTFIAACTETIRLGTSVLVLPYRPPIQTAKQIASLDVLSEGRVIFGVGVGWMAEEAAILGMPWDRRGQRSDEQLAVFKTLFEDEAPSSDGEFYPFPTVGFEPKPVQTPLPIWVGGATPAAFRRVAEYGHGFHAAFQALDELENGWRKVLAACEAAQRDPAGIRFSVRIYLDPRSAMPAHQAIAGDRDQMLKTIDQLKSIGVDHIVLDPVARGGVEGRLDAVRRFLEDVAPAAD